MKDLIEGPSRDEEFRRGGKHDSEVTSWRVNEKHETWV